MRAVQDQIAPWVRHTWCSLGTDGFGFADTRAAARRYFLVDAESIVVATLRIAGPGRSVRRERCSRRLRSLSPRRPDRGRRSGTRGRRRLADLLLTGRSRGLGNRQVLPLERALEVRFSTSSTACALPAICQRVSPTTNSSATPPAPITSAAPGYQSQRVEIGLQEDAEPAARDPGQVDRGGSEYPQCGGRGHHRLPRGQASPVRKMSRMVVGRDRDLGEALAEQRRAPVLR